MCIHSNSGWRGEGTLEVHLVRPFRSRPNRRDQDVLFKHSTVPQLYSLPFSSFSLLNNHRFVRPRVVWSVQEDLVADGIQFKIGALKLPWHEIVSSRLNVSQ